MSPFYFFLIQNNNTVLLFILVNVNNVNIVKLKIVLKPIVNVNNANKPKIEIKPLIQLNPKYKSLEFIETYYKRTNDKNDMIPNEDFINQWLKYFKQEKVTMNHIGKELKRLGISYDNLTRCQGKKKRGVIFGFGLK